MAGYLVDFPSMAQAPSVDRWAGSDMGDSELIEKLGDLDLRERNVDLDPCAWPGLGS